ncbi:unnamed protein product [Lactuca virosa]|uniref:SHSP domain-containing protein n=1 Tax=Lactuca virosa TaxID=75947 RepID=A0AAU9MBS4_9ASTR|nr:unnamed protein product [Lactuca virosa]
MEISSSLLLALIKSRNFLDLLTSAPRFWSNIEPVEIMYQKDNEDVNIIIKFPGLTQQTDEDLRWSSNIRNHKS